MFYCGDVCNAGLVTQNCHLAFSPYEKHFFRHDIHVKSLPSDVQTVVFTFFYVPLHFKPVCLCASLSVVMQGDGYILLLPQLGISLTSWAQMVLSMNRYKGCCRFRLSDLWGLVLLVHAGFVRWIATLATRSDTLLFQISASVIAAILGWVSFVVIFNGDFLLPTRQQTLSLVMSLVVTMLWEINNRILFHM